MHKLFFAGTGKVTLKLEAVIQSMQQNEEENIYSATMFFFFNIRNKKKVIQV